MEYTTVGYDFMTVTRIFLSSQSGICLEQVIGHLFKKFQKESKSSDSNAILRIRANCLIFLLFYEVKAMQKSLVRFDFRALVPFQHNSNMSLSIHTRNSLRSITSNTRTVVICQPSNLSLIKVLRRLYLQLLD